MPPAQRLTGLELPNGWKVGARLLFANTTGGNFSCSYEVSHSDGGRAFLKALDYSRALRSPDPPVALQALTSGFVFERDILQKCSQKHMDRVIRYLESGNVLVDATEIGRVDYLIFEMADSDLRTYLSANADLENAWRLRSLHHVATGLNQLHSANVAHQDLKPSNVLIFGGADCKVSDLGSASLKGTLSPRDNFGFAGDPSYAPPELLYGYMDPEWARRRQGCDVYLLGSMVAFLFGGVNFTALLLSKLAPEHRPKKWTGTYAEVLPYLRVAFGDALASFGQQIKDNALRTELTTLVSYLCEPDSALRGHPRNRVGHGQQFSLERFVSKLDLLASRAEIRAR